MKQSLQDTYGSKCVCYGCGPANQQGFQIKSYVDGAKVVATYHPKAHHHAFPNVLNGGVIGTLLDCHCNWAAAWYLMQDQKLETTPCTVTAEYTIKLLRPTPMDTELKLEAELEKIEGNKAFINGKIIANDKVCDTCHGIFVAVEPGHPAYHRW
jgi:acyl-coenzyme A thioesterase PaaI-like protein